MFVITKETARYLLEQMINYDINEAIIDVSTNSYGEVTDISFDLYRREDILESIFVAEQ